jgi:agmatinase
MNKATHGEDSSSLVLLPVPFAATSRGRSSDAYAGIRCQWLRLPDWEAELGRVNEPGVCLREPDQEIVRWDEEARAKAELVVSLGDGATDLREREEAVALVNDRCSRVNTHVYERSKALLDAGKIVGVIGGDHGAAYGLIRAVSEKWHGLGVLHVDAHAGLRERHQGFEWSHASIMHNVMTRLPGVARVVQVAVRDICEAELTFIRQSPKLTTNFDATLARERAGGTPWLMQAERMVARLPQNVFISLGVDGLDPTLCPNTGTPVPGGLSFNDAALLVSVVAQSGRRIVGFDLNEVAPGPEGDEWDGNVAARLLYRLIGWTFASQGLLLPV